MANNFIKAEQVAAAALGLLEREVLLPGLVWRDAVTDFKGAKDDTVSVRVPAYMNARTRTMRSGTGITIDELDETKVDVTLDTHVYKAVGVTDEEMTLDIVNFGLQVLNPAMGSVVRKVEDLLAAEMAAASYQTTIALDEDDPYLGLVDAREALNMANVPAGQRFLACGSKVESAILKSDRLSKFDTSGSSETLREAIIGRIAGFTAVSIPGLDPNIAIPAHRTAFVLSMVAPAVPDGASWGTTQSFNGFALRTLKDYDMTNVKDRLLTDVFVGTATTKDRGTLDEDGRFTPSEDGEDSPILVRAVKCELSASS